MFFMSVLRHEWIDFCLFIFLLNMELNINLLLFLFIKVQSIIMDTRGFLMELFRRFCRMMGDELNFRGHDRGCDVFFWLVI